MVKRRFTSRWQMTWRCVFLQRAIVYYNESDDTYLAYKVMPLQQYALSIAEGAQAKQHCLKNVEILQGIIAKLPPEEVADEMKFINSALEKFVKKEENQGLFLQEI